MATGTLSTSTLIQEQAEKQAAAAKAEAIRLAEEAEKKAKQAEEEAKEGVKFVTFYHRHPGAAYYECIGPGQVVKHIFPPAGLRLKLGRDDKLINELAEIVDKTDIFFAKPVDEDPSIAEALSQARIRAEASMDKLAGKK